MKIAVAKGDGIGPEIMDAVIDVFNAAKARQAEMDRDEAKETAALKAEEKKRKEEEQEQMAWAIGIVVIVMFLGAVGWGIAEIQDMCAQTKCGR